MGLRTLSVCTRLTSIVINPATAAYNSGRNRQFWRVTRNLFCVRRQGMPGTMNTYRPPIMGTTHMVSAGHYLAASAGYRILEDGGNAIDAGVAAGIAST